MEQNFLILRHVDVPLGDGGVEFAKVKANEKKSIGSG